MDNSVESLSILLLNCNFCYTKSVKSAKLIVMYSKLANLEHHTTQWRLSGNFQGFVSVDNQTDKQ